MNELKEQITINQTPIEIALGIDEEGTTTARDLYGFLELASGQFSRWAKLNIIDNAFAEEGIDYWGFDINVEGNITKDYRLTAQFAKKLSMMAKSEKGNIARDYFIAVEDKAKEVSLRMRGLSMEDVIIYTMQEMKQIKSDISDMKHQAFISDTKINEVLDKVTINSRQKVQLINLLKDRLSEITGEKIKAADYDFRMVRLRIFKKYSVTKWEELTVTQYNAVFADIDSLEEVNY